MKSGIGTKFKPDITWEYTATDLLELVTALYEAGAINNTKEDLTRKDVIKFFEFIFNYPIKDAESKLSKATAVRKDPTPFLDSLTKTFIHYSSEKTK